MEVDNEDGDESVVTAPAPTPDVTVVGPAVERPPTPPIPARVKGDAGSGLISPPNAL